MYEKIKSKHLDSFLWHIYKLKLKSREDTKQTATRNGPSQCDRDGW